MNTPTAVDDMGLAGKVAVVTGASSGIGRACALELARLGAHVALLNRDHQSSEAQAVLAQVSAMGVQAVALSCDTSDEAAVAEAARQVERQLGPADVLVNAAGILKAGSLAELSALAVAPRAGRQPDRLLFVRPSLWPAHAGPPGKAASCMCLPWWPSWPRRIRVRMPPAKPACSCSRTNSRWSGDPWACAATPSAQA
jgi:hypothetical protein